MKVRDIMTAEIATAALDTTLDEIATLMRDEDAGAIPIVDGDELQGLVTDRDIVLRCIAAGKDPAETSAEEVLSEELHTIEPNSSVEEAARLMAERQIRRLPVVESGRLVGMVSLGDIAVKSEEEKAADALENISEGVKATRAPKAARRPAAQPARKQEAESFRAPRGETGGTSELARRGSNQTGVSGASPQRQAISNRSAQQEERRQARVVPIREGKKSKKRRAS